MEKQKIIKTVVISFISLFAAAVVFGAIVYYNEQNKYEFTGQSTQGEISLRDLKGHNVVIYFGYTVYSVVSSL